jgi:hypothetical protein
VGQRPAYLVFRAELGGAHPLMLEPAAGPFLQLPAQRAAALLDWAIPLALCRGRPLNGV